MAREVVPARIWNIGAYHLRRVAELPAGAGNERDGWMPAMLPQFQRVAFPNSAKAGRVNHYWSGLLGGPGQVVTYLAHEYRALYHRVVSQATDAGLLT